MEDRYYTPALNEFYIGFEFESAEGFMDGTVKSQEEFDNAKWEKNAFVNQYDFPYLTRALTGINAKNGKCGIRVKRLDQDDIRELGWVNGVYNEQYDITLLMVDKDHNPIPYIRYILIGNRRRDVLFRGEIKNKSELRKLMKQIGI